jgi:hypothetical protein
LLALLTLVLAGLSFLFGGDSPIYEAGTIPPLAVLDSNLRFMGGMENGLGLVLLWIIPTIEKHALIYRH